MNCISPPEPEDRLLLAYLDGEADQDIALHLQNCRYCRERTKALSRMQNSLKSRLYRVTCPSSVELGEFHLRILPPTQMLIISQHLRDCPHCTREVSQLEEFLNEAPPRPSLLEPVKVLIAHLVSPRDVDRKSESSPLVPAFAGLRGEGEEPFIYQADQVQIIIEVREDTDHPDLKVLLGLVIGVASSGITVKASREGEVIDIVSVDEIGNFVIPHLVSDVYELTFIGADTEIRIPAISI